MALIDKVSRADLEKVAQGNQAFNTVGIDWGLLQTIGLPLLKEALARVVWEAIQQDPEAELFKLRIDTKVWFIPIRLNWGVKAKDILPVYKWIFGNPPVEA